MRGTAVLIAIQVILPRLRRGKPKRRVVAGHDILLEPEGGNRKIMNHILGSHRECYANTHRYAELVDVTPSIRILNFPHPLLSYHEDFGRRGWWNPIADEKSGAPHEHHNADGCGNYGPGDLKEKMVLGLRRR